MGLGVVATVKELTVLEVNSTQAGMYMFRASISGYGPPQVYTQCIWLKYKVRTAAKMHVHPEKNSTFFHKLYMQLDNGHSQAYYIGSNSWSGCVVVSSQSV